MRSATLITITKMIESLPKDKQEQVLNHFLVTSLCFQ